MNEPAQIEDKLKRINLYVNDLCNADDVWSFFAGNSIAMTNITVVHDLLYAAVKWQYEIIQQIPMNSIVANEEVSKLLDQVHIDKPQVFYGGVVMRRYFCDLVQYLKTMYASGDGEAFDRAEESDAEPVTLAFDRADEFAKQTLPKVPFQCQIAESSSVKAWRTTLQKLTYAEINLLRSEVGNAVDWNQLNDTFLVEFKGDMYWIPRNSIQSCDDRISGSNSRTSEAETTPSITVDAGRSEARSKTPTRILSGQDTPTLMVRHGSQGSSRSSLTSPPSNVNNINKLITQRFRENLSSDNTNTNKQQRKQVGHRTYHSVGNLRTQLNGPKVIVKGAPPDQLEEDIAGLETPPRRMPNRTHARSFSARLGSGPTGLSSFRHQLPELPEDVDVYLSDDIGRIRSFFSNYNVSEREIQAIVGRRIRVDEWNEPLQQGRITLNNQLIWLPPEIAYRVYDGADDEPEIPKRSAIDSNMINVRLLHKRYQTNKRRQEMTDDMYNPSSSRFRSTSTNSVNSRSRVVRSVERAMVSSFSRDSPLLSYGSFSSVPQLSALSLAENSSVFPSMSPLSTASADPVLPPSILRSSSKSPGPQKKKKASFSAKISTVIPAPGFYYIQRNRNLLFKKCTIHRLDSRRLIGLMGRRIEITHINRNGCGLFSMNDRDIQIPMDCLSIERPSITSPD